MPARGNLQIVDYVWPNAVGNKTTLVGVIGELFASELPAQILGLQFHWMGSFRDAEPGSGHDVVLELVSEEGTRTPLVQAKLRIMDPTQALSFHAALPPVPVTSTGWAAFILSVGGVEASRVDLPVVKRPST